MYVGEEEITEEIPAANFNWTKVTENGTETPNWKTGVKSVSLTQADLSGATEIRCEVTRTSEYGTVQVNDEMMASHTPAEDDANDVFSIENGNLMLNTTDTENPYIIEDNCLKVEAGLGVNLTAKAVVYPKLPDKMVEFKYNSEGLRTQKKVILPNGKSTTTEYILHGKLITEMRKGQDVLHFFYDEQSRPATVKYNGKTYTYIHNLQGDIMGILDSAGSLVVEYRYDVWGKPLNITGLLADTLGRLNPFRYRGYVFDQEIALYYLKSRYYAAETHRFINCDGLISFLTFRGQNGFAYCENGPVNFTDEDGRCIHKWYLLGLVDCARCKAKKEYMERRSVQYNVPLYSQGSYNLCWAFCQTMVESFKIGVTLSQNDATKRSIKIAKTLTKSDEREIWDKGNWPTNIKGKAQACESIDELYEMLFDGPVYAYYQNSEHTSSHLIVVTGVDIDNDKVFTNNPWGVSGSQTFEEFQNGFLGLDGVTNTSMNLNAIYLIE